MAKVKVAAKVQPLQDRILVRRLDAEEEEVGGIIIPDTAKEKPQEGAVMAVGPGKVTDDGKRQAVEVEKGDRILFAKYAGTEVKVEGEELLIMREDDVLAVLREGDFPPSALKAERHTETRSGREGARYGKIAFVR